MADDLKDELGGVIMKEFIELRWKIFSYRTDYDKVLKTQQKALTNVSLTMK